MTWGIKTRELLDPFSKVSSSRWIAIRSAQTLGATSIAMTLAVLYQVGTNQKIDPQLSFLLGGNFTALAILSGASVVTRTSPQKEEVPKP